ncbi:Mu transposase C-terminal domain-containing protein [Pseudomonas putida]
MDIELKKGLQVIARGKGAIITSFIDQHHVAARVSSTGENITLDLSEIEFLLDYDDPTVTSLVNGIPQVSDEEYVEAKRRFEILVKVAEGEISKKQAALEIGISINHIYKILRGFDQAKGPISVARVSRGVKSGEMRLSQEVEEVIGSAINKFKGKEAIPFSAVWKEVEVLCIEKGLKTPSKPTVTKRILTSLTPYQVTSLRKGKEVSAQKHKAKPGVKLATYPLELVQMDHTLGDCILLANDRIHPIGRPWATFVMDRYSRVLLGYYLSLHVPSTISVASALTHAVLPKWEFLERMGVDKFSYPFFGVPQLLGMDNAKEFTRSGFLLELDKAQIHYKHRPPGRKHFGGHVERIIGTFMGDLHLLSGRTMSNAVARKNLHTSGVPTMTFSEFCHWFFLKVCEYHDTVHSELGKSPAQTWAEYYDPTGVTPYPPFTTDPQQFRLHFMPSEERNVQTKGIEFKHMYYWDNVLSPLVGIGKVTIKYDPMSLKQIWVKFPSGFVPIPFADMSKPDYSYEEYRAASFYSGRQTPGSFTTQEGPAAYREAGAIEVKSKRETKKATRQAAAKEEYEKAFYPTNKSSASKDLPDYSKPPKKFDVGEGS